METDQIEIANRFAASVDEVITYDSPRGSSTVILIRKGFNTKELLTLRNALSPFEVPEYKLSELLVNVLSNLPRVAQFLKDESLLK